MPIDPPRPPFHTARLGAFACAILLILSSCGLDGKASLYASGPKKTQIRTLLSLIRTHGPEGEDPDPRSRFAAAESLSALLIGEKREGSAAALLQGLAEEDDAYASWYLFAAAAAYETRGELALAIPLYERLVKTHSDLDLGGKSLHYEALRRLARSAGRPERKIEYYRDLVTRFPDAADTGASIFLLAKAYEAAGNWKEALAAYSSFLPYIGAKVPGYPDAHQYARRLVEFNASPKDWTYESLEDLVGKVRAALASGSSRQLRRLSARAGFFASSWFKDGEQDGNSKVNFDLGEFMQGRSIRSEPSLHPSSNSREAYLRTWGWTGRVPVWYLYFRRIDFPADPEVHGRWEWAGIYFGERLR
ncbi:MAG TPA: tetratricopeptide repeat protein [Rectinemataceae bacterium]